MIENFDSCLPCPLADEAFIMRAKTTTHTFNVIRAIKLRRE
jgi:hypothetical protein